MKCVRYNGQLWRVVKVYGAFALLRSLLNHTTETVAPATECRPL